MGFGLDGMGVEFAVNTKLLKVYGMASLLNFRFADFEAERWIKRKISLKKKQC